MKSRALLLTSILLIFAGASATRGATLELVAGGTREEVGIPAKEARLREPFGTEFDGAGDMWIVEMTSGNRLLKVDAAGVLQHVAGQLKPGLSQDPGPALTASFNGPHNLAVLPNGGVLIADTFNGLIRKVLVGKGEMAPPLALRYTDPKVRMAKPFCITLDAVGAKLYVADLKRVWVIELASGDCRVIAGNGQKGIPADGAVAAEAPLVDPRAVAPDGQENVYILERDGHALRVVNAGGKIRTVVNVAGIKGASGYGGPAAQATMNAPKHLCVDRDGSVIIADAENHLIVRYQPKDGTLTKLAGIGKKGAGQPGAEPLATALARPHGVTIHPKSGELYVTDSYNDRVLRLVP